jgi:hypothetical protein
MTGGREDWAGYGGQAGRAFPGRPTTEQLEWLRRGIDQPGGKLPLFDRYGQNVSPRTIRACIDHGWAEPWFSNPLKPDWLVCKLTSEGRSLIGPKR